MSGAGRICPLRYRYGAAALAKAPASAVSTLYVVGGLYGNLPALDAIEALAAAEGGPVTIVFNGDFHWFDVDDEGFVEVQRRVLAHDAILGNVEAELGGEGDEAGCGCAYPASVSADTVERSNRIHARLKRTAARHPELVAQFDALPMLARYVVGGLAVGVVHGDAESLAGWRFDPAELDDASNRAWVERAFSQADVDVFASSHTCAAGLRVFDGGIVVNNGAAGLSNPPLHRHGLLTRIATTPSPHASQAGVERRGTHVDAVAIEYDTAAWVSRFRANWPEGSDADRSYWSRIAPGTTADAMSEAFR